MLESELRNRAHLLAARRLSSRPGAAERFRQYLENPPGSNAWRFLVLALAMPASPFGPSGPGSCDADLLGFIDQWAQGDASPDDVAPLPTLANDAASSATAAPVRAEWTPERLTALKAYRDAHGTKATAAHFGIHASRVRQLLPGDKPRPSPFPGVARRTK